MFPLSLYNNITFTYEINHQGSPLTPSGEEPWVVTQGLLVAAEAVAALQAAAVGCLGRLMPTLIKTLAASTVSATTAGAASTANSASDTAAATPAPAATTQLLATLTALHKVVMFCCIPFFQSRRHFSDGHNLSLKKK